MKVPEMPALGPGVGAVVIGRNEGARLVRCISALVAARVATVVYVDSGSTDDSVKDANRLGAAVIKLSLDRPFTAGRARNAGYKHLLSLRPQVEFVQFIDGDCELCEAWLGAASEFLMRTPSAAIACGRRRERNPDASIYNALCDIEWNTPVGKADECGGDFLARVQAFSAIGGFDDNLIAGEEPEMCYRLRRDGWEIHRLDVDMTFHDAAIMRYGQWARRCCRSGYAFLARAVLHMHDGTYYCWKPNLRIVFWAFVVPLTIAIGSVCVSVQWAWGVAVYAIPLFRSWRHARHQLESSRVAPLQFAIFSLTGKWLEFWGQLLFMARLLFHKRQVLIEYK